MFNQVLRGIEVTMRMGLSSRPSVLVDELDDVHLRQRSAGQDGRLLHERLVEIHLIHFEGEMLGYLQKHHMAGCQR